MTKAMPEIDNWIVDPSSYLHSLKYSSIGYPLWQYWIDMQDPRTANFFFVNQSPYSVLTLMALYLYISLSLGPRLMRHRAAFDNLKPLMLLYNFSMVLCNAFFVTLVLYYCEWGHRFFVWKFPDTKDQSPQTLYELNLAWWYLLTKFLDLFDTFFFILRKKHETHLSFLHLYHHTTVPILGFACLKINATVPALGLLTLINGSVHVIMYSYYGLSLLGPSVRKYLWWKKVITQLQISQFIIGILYGTVFAFKQEGYPQIYFWIAFSQAIIFLGLFGTFYRRSYQKPTKDE